MPNDNQQDSNPNNQNQIDDIKTEGANIAQTTILPILTTESMDVPPPPAGMLNREIPATQPVEKPIAENIATYENSTNESEATTKPENNTFQEEKHVDIKGVQTQLDIPSVVTTTPETKRSGKKPKSPGTKKMTAAVLGVLLLVGAVASGVILTQQNQNINKKADTQEVCSIQSTGGCAGLAWGANCGTQASGNPLVCSLQEPAQVGSDGNQICQCAPQGSGTKINLSCTGIKIYTVTDAASASSWQLVSPSQYSSLSKGEDIYITVSGSVTENEVGKNTIDKARFSIVFEQISKDHLTWTESITKKPGSEEYYYKFTVPENEPTFYINAELHDNSSDTWF